MEIKVVETKITIPELEEFAKTRFGDLVKAVVDVEKGVMAIGGELHADEEALMLERGSKQENLWGINIYPAAKGDEFIEFDSMINLRPSQGNKSRGVESQELREKIRFIVNSLAAI